MAQELNYDVAIISLARLLGLEVDVGAFDQPMLERSRLEKDLQAAGIDVRRT